MTDPKPRVLAVSDLSAAGDVAIGEAQRRARELNATLGVVHAIPSIDSIRPLFPQRLADDVVLATELPVRAEATLRHRLEELGVADPDLEVFIEQGTTADGALSVVERWRPQLVVIGVPDGAVDAHRLVRHVSVPILVARTSPQTRRVIAGTDFSDPSLPALRAAAEVSARMRGELVVAHAIEVNPISIYGVDLPTMIHLAKPDVMHAAAQRRLDEAVRELGVEATTAVCVGSPASSLVELARDRDAELLVLGTHGRTGFTRFVLGSVAETVIQRAPCSVLIVRVA